MQPDPHNDDPQQIPEVGAEPADKSTFRAFVSEFEIGQSVSHPQLTVITARYLAGRAELIFDQRAVPELIEALQAFVTDSDALMVPEGIALPNGYMPPAPGPRE